MYKLYQLSVYNLALFLRNKHKSKFNEYGV